MSSKPQKPELKTEIVANKYYWVRPYHKDEFEPAKCKELYGTNKLYFFFTNGSRMEIERAWEVEPLCR